MQPLLKSLNSINSPQAHNERKTGFKSLKKWYNMHMKNGITNREGYFGKEGGKIP